MIMAIQTKWQNTSFRVGDNIAVHHKVKEGDKERVQIFQGIVMAIRGNGMGRNIIVRKISESIGVERIWPIACPSITNIVLKKKGQVRRAKLYYLRNRQGKTALKTKKETLWKTEAEASAPTHTNAKLPSAKPEAKTGKSGRSAGQKKAVK